MFYFSSAETVGIHSKKCSNRRWSSRCRLSFLKVYVLTHFWLCRFSCLTWRFTGRKSETEIIQFSLSAVSGTLHLLYEPWSLHSLTLPTSSDLCSCWINRVTLFNPSRAVFFFSVWKTTSLHILCRVTLRCLMKLFGFPTNIQNKVQWDWTILCWCL